MALMARQSGQRLAEERKRHGLTQAQHAHAMGVTADGIELLNPVTVTITRYRYRGTRIPSPWDTAA